MRKVLALLLSVVMALSLTVSAAWADPVEQDLAGKTVILHTNDVHGDIAKYAKVAALKSELKARGADAVICLAHLGVDSSSEPNTSYDLLKNVPDIDFVIDGHSHSVMLAGYEKLQTGVDEEGNPTYIDNP